MASSSTALSLYEKYTQLNHQLDETREKRVSLQKRVNDIHERLEQYETEDKPTMLESTRKAREEVVHWQGRIDTDQQTLFDLQTQRDDLVRTRDRLEQSSTGQREKHRIQCRSFLSESRTFRQRQCPQLHLQLSVLFGEASSLVQVDKIIRLRAVALANGWDAGKLPEEDIQDDTIPVNMKQYEDLKVSSTEDVDWDILDVAFAEEEHVDDDDIREKLQEYNELRRRFQASNRDLQKEEERLNGEVEDKFQAALRRKRQFVDKLQSVTKEVQQLEVDISVTLAAQDIAATEFEDVNVFQEPATILDQDKPCDRRLSKSPAQEGVMNPYQRRMNKPPSGNSSLTESTPRARPAETPGPTVAAQPISSYISRYNHSRKRKSCFGSSVQIGGAEAPREDVPASTVPSYPRASILENMDDEDEDEDELLNFSPFRRKKA